MASCCSYGGYPPSHTRGRQGPGLAGRAVQHAQVGGCWCPGTRRRAAAVGPSAPGFLVRVQVGEVEASIAHDVGFAFAPSDPPPSARISRCAKGFCDTRPRRGSPARRPAVSRQTSVLAAPSANSWSLTGAGGYRLTTSIGKGYSRWCIAAAQGLPWRNQSRLR